jgi:Flp pilus assembly protein TadD
VIDPEYTDAWEGKGDALKELGRADEANECHQKAEELRP